MRRRFAYTGGAGRLAILWHRISPKSHRNAQRFGPPGANPTIRGYVFVSEDEDFEKAAAEPAGALHKALPISADDKRSDANNQSAADDNPLVCASDCYCTSVAVVREGFEPPTKGL